MRFSTDPRPLPARCATMAELRQGVDARDRLMVEAPAERQRYMDAAARIKPRIEAVRDEARVEEVVTSSRSSVSRSPPRASPANGPSAPR
jgi:isochorismate pyruvate lyase